MLLAMAMYFLWKPISDVDVKNCNVFVHWLYCNED